MPGIFGVVEVAFGAGLRSFKPGIFFSEKRQNIGFKAAVMFAAVHVGPDKVAIWRACVYPGSD